uniref:NADH-ubiquinone oxidoreductase chain 4L n=1 Tax=Schistometopum gregorii TaxID=260982 RepID=W5RH73_9AMPH|nr:NADH dehydrogenase subunit 4L [Schistometopum gregorii]AGZ19106.1 NADH dehydrogenase subunit 4L [Schistometopum gregorii]
MTPMNFSIYSAFMISLTGLTLHRTHLLSALICLEGLMLSLFTGLTLWCLQMESMLPSISPMTLLTMSACEAGTGLAILIATTRNYGSDLMQNLNLLKC